MKKILITFNIPYIARDILSKKFHLDINNKELLSKEQLKEAVAKYDGILSTVSDVLDEEVLSCAKTLKVISQYSVGMDNIDVEYAKSRGITVCNLPSIVTNSTADLTFAIFLTLIRKVCEARDYVRKDLWKQWEPDFFAGEELFGKNFGIIGFGRIGKAVAKRALGFGLKVIFCHQRKIELSKDLEGCVQVSEDKLLESADYISLHVPLTEETKGMVNIDMIKKMKKKPILINMARGKVVKTEHLVEALKNKLIRGVALDVTDPEPLSGNHPLCFFDNCIIVPHIGASTIDCHQEMSKKSLENIINFFNKK